jgi:Tol biopolymer transport system component
MVGMIGEDDEVRWVVVGEVEGEWQVKGSSPPLATGFEAPPPSYLPPERIDFDEDGQQEIRSSYFNLRGGWLTGADTLYRWNGEALTPIWSTTTVLDNRSAGPNDVVEPYRQEYDATWEWVDLDEDGLDEIRLQEEVAFYLPGEDGYVPEEASPIGEEQAERTFRWNGTRFAPQATGGPPLPFAVAALDGIQLWRAAVAHPLDATGAAELAWSPEGRRLAWISAAYAAPPRLGLHDRTSGATTYFALEAQPSDLQWASAEQLILTMPEGPTLLIETATGEYAALDLPTTGPWSPTGGRMLYEEGMDLQLYDLETEQTRPLVAAPEGAGDVVPGATAPLWAPDGEHVALLLENASGVWVGVVPTDLAEPVSSASLVEPFAGREAVKAQLAWTPGGDRLAALTLETGEGNADLVLHVAQLEGDLPVWEEINRWENVDTEASLDLAWAPDGQRITLVLGTGVWEYSPATGVVLRYLFAYPEPRWLALAWAPDGSGYLLLLDDALYQGRLFWFPAPLEEEHRTLVAATLESVAWAPRVLPPADAALTQPRVFVERSEPPRLHFFDGAGEEIAIAVEGAQPKGVFRVGGERVYYDARYADATGSSELPVPEVLTACRPPLPHPAGDRLAWLCYDQLPVPGDESTLQTEYRVVLTGGQGEEPQEIGQFVTAAPDYRSLQLHDWSADGSTLYLLQREPMVTWAHFTYAPSLIALEVETGLVTVVEGQENAFESRVSPGGTWFAQSTATETLETTEILLRQLEDGTERRIPGTAGSGLAGDLSFSPDGTWLVWREWSAGPPQRFLVRALRLPDGVPFLLHEQPLEEGEDSPHLSIAGWLDDESVVLSGSGGPSYALRLPSAPLVPLSPFEFLELLR